MATDDEVGATVGVLFGIKILDELNLISAGAGRFAGHIAGVEANAPVVAQLAEHLQKIALAATNLDDVLAMEIVPRHQVPGQGFGVLLEAGREVKGILVDLGIVHQAQVERRVEDMPAVGTEGQRDVHPRDGNGFLTRGPKDVAEDGYIGDLDENFAFLTVADGAGCWR